jgi:hypothetical protein
VKQDQPFKLFAFRPTDERKTFEVKIPCEVFSAFKALSPDQHDKIRTSWVKTRLDLATKNREKQEIALFSRMLEILRGYFAELELTDRQEEPRTIARAIEPILVKISYNPNAKQDALWLMQFEEFRTDMSAKTVSRVLAKAVTQAVGDNDIDFFKQLGRRLSERPKPLIKNFNLNPLKHLMLSHWVADDSKLQFCYFTDQALRDFLNIVASGAGATFDSVRQTRKRLRLQRTNPLFVKKVAQKNGAILLS